MSAIDEGGAAVIAILTRPDPEPATTDAEAVALLDDLSRRMREAASEFRRPAGAMTGGVWAEWADEQTRENPSQSSDG